MRCASCDAENGPGRRFCQSCGRALSVACPSCGEANQPGAAFCGECGARLEAPPVAATPFDPTAGLERLVPKEFAARLRATRGRVEPERRLVTILFSDIKGSTACAIARTTGRL